MLAVSGGMGLSLRGWAAVGVLAAWGGSLAWLAQRHYGVSESDRLANEASLRLSPGDVWFAVMAGDQQVGYVGLTLDTLSPGYRLTELGATAVRQGSDAVLAVRNVRHDLTPSLSLRSSSTRYTFEPYRWRDSTVVTGGTATYLVDTTETGSAMGEADAGLPLLIAPYRLAITGALATGAERPITIRDGQPPISATVDLVSGRDSVMIVADSAELDPATSRWREASFDTIDTRLLLVASPAGPVILRVDRRGTLASLRYPLGVTWARTDFSIAMADFRQRFPQLAPAVAEALPEIISLASSSIPTDTTTGRTSYRLTRRDGTPVSMRDAGFFTDGRQHVDRNGFIVIESEGPPGGDPGTPVRDPLIQTADSAVAVLAAVLRPQIEREEWRAVAAAIRSRVAVDHGSDAAAGAAATLARGRGSPDGIARLFAAVLEINGVRARHAVGVLPRDGRMYSHAWTEIWNRRERRWLAADPVFGRGVAGTGFFRIGGSTSRPDLILPALADVRFELVDDGREEGGRQ